MPVIREYGRKVGTPQAMSNMRISGSDLGMGGEIRQFAGAVSQAAGAFGEIQAKQQAFDVEMQSAKEYADLQTWFEEKKTSAPEGADGFTEQVKEELEARKQSALEAAPSSYAKDLLNSRYTSLHNQMLGEAVNFQSRAKATKAKSDLTVLSDQYKNLVFSDPSKLSTTLQQSDILISENPYLDNTTKGTLLSSERQALYDTAMDGRVTKLVTSPSATLGQVKGLLREMDAEGSVWKQMQSPQAYQSSKTTLMKYADTLQAKETEISTTDFKERMRQLREPETDTDHGMWTEKQIRATFGNEPRVAEAMIKEQELARAQFQATRAARTAPMDKVEAALSQKIASFGTTNEFDKTHQEAEALERGLTARRQGLTKDAVAWYASNDDQFAMLYGAVAMSQGAEPEVRAEVFDKYAKEALVIQKRAAPSYPPSLVGANEAALMATKIEAMKSEAGGAGKLMEFIQEEKRVSGEHWPIVASDYTKHKAFNDEMVVIANMGNDAEDRMVAEKLLKVSVADKKTLLDFARGNENKAGEIRKLAQEALSDYTSSLVATGQEMGIEAAKPFVNSIYNVLLSEAAGGKTVDASMAKEIANQLALKKYSFETDYRAPDAPGDGKYRLPAERDAGRISYTVDTLQTWGSKIDFVPPGRSDPTYKSNLLREGYFVTTPDEKGLELRDRNGHNVKMNVNGEKVKAVFTWDELEGGWDRRALQKYFTPGGN